MTVMLCVCHNHSNTEQSCLQSFCLAGSPRQLGSKIALYMCFFKDRRHATVSEVELRFCNHLILAWHYTNELCHCCCHQLLPARVHPEIFYNIDVYQSESYHLVAA